MAMRTMKYEITNIANVIYPINSIILSVTEYKGTSA